MQQFENRPKLLFRQPGSLRYNEIVRPEAGSTIVLNLPPVLGSKK